MALTDVSALPDYAGVPQSHHHAALRRTPEQAAQAHDYVYDDPPRASASWVGKTFGAHCDEHLVRNS